MGGVPVMRLEWQRLLRAPLSGEPLRFEGSYVGQSESDWDGGRLITPRGFSVAAVKNGIPDFVQSNTWATFEATKAKNRDHWITQGWGRQIALAHEEPFPDVVSAIIDAGPLILELGAGPGGGHMPMVLERLPDASILVNDFEFGMLDDWRVFFNSRGLGPAVSLACFDACVMPITADSADCVSSHGCFSNISNRSLDAHTWSRVGFISGKRRILDHQRSLFGAKVGLA
jgi:hypothetical protein